MKGKLHKMVSGYILSLNGDIDDPYAIVNEELAKDHEWHRLSLKNCQAIERGYDLDELVLKEFPYDFDCPLFETLGIIEKVQKSILIGMLQGTLQKGFQKALEILGDKKFSEDDMVDCWETAHQAGRFEGKGIAEKDWQTSREYIQSLQQTEWEVEIVTKKVIDETKIVGSVKGVKGSGSKITTYKSVPLLDDDGRLILKKI